MYLGKRLNSQLQGGAREITKAAQSLNELGKKRDHISVVIHRAQVSGMHQNCNVEDTVNLYMDS